MATLDNTTTFSFFYHIAGAGIVVLLVLLTDWSRLIIGRIGAERLFHLRRHDTPHMRYCSIPEAVDD